MLRGFPAPFDPVTETFSLDYEETAGAAVTVRDFSMTLGTTVFDETNVSGFTQLQTHPTYGETPAYRTWSSTSYATSSLPGNTVSTTGTSAPIPLPGGLPLLAGALGRRVSRG